MPTNFSHPTRTHSHPSGGVMKQKSRVHARAWKPEEEAYLLRARGRSIPYRQIGAQLNKTELACRLHFHQMSYGANRRKDRSSTVDARSDTSHSPRSTYEDPRSSLTTPAITLSHPSSSSSFMRTTPNFGHGRMYSPPAKYYSEPAMKPFQHYDVSPSLGLHSKPTNAWQELAGAAQGNVDLTRLLYRYADNSRAFWSNIADQYSEIAQQPPSELDNSLSASGTGNIMRPASTNDSTSRYLAPPVLSNDTSNRRSSSEPRDRIDRRVLSPSPKRCTVSSLLNSEKQNIIPRAWGVSGA